MLVGVDVGGTKTAVMVATVEGSVVTRLRRPTDLADLVGGIRRAIHAALREAAVSVADVQGIGLGFPGLVNVVRGSVELAVNLNVYEPVMLGDALSAEFHTPVALENDIRLATLGVQQQFDVPNLAYLGIGTGVAAGIILNNQLWRGQSGMAGEIGHMMVDDAGTVLEQHIAGPALLKLANAADVHVKQAGEVYTLAANGDSAAQAIVSQVVRYVARAIHWLIMMYDVEKVVLGGGVTHVGDAFLAPVLQEMARLRTLSALNQTLLPDSKIALLPSQYNAGLYGAVRLAQRMMD